MSSECSPGAPVVLQAGICDLQVCVPDLWTDHQVEAFVNGVQPTGLDHGWTVCKPGDKSLGKNLQRNPCADRKGFVHVKLTC